MDYNILECRIEYEENKLKRITVLVEISKNDIRAIYATTKPSFGYMWIKPDSVISEELLNDVAICGIQTIDRDKIFPGWEAKYYLKVPKL